MLIDVLLLLGVAPPGRRLVGEVSGDRSGCRTVLYPMVDRTDAARITQMT
jgi:hypothetical protein